MQSIVSINWWFALNAFPVGDCSSQRCNVFPFFVVTAALCVRYDTRSWDLTVAPFPRRAWERETMEKNEKDDVFFKVCDRIWQTGMLGCFPFRMNAGCFLDESGASTGYWRGWPGIAGIFRNNRRGGRGSQGLTGFGELMGKKILLCPPRSHAPAWERIVQWIHEIG